MTHIPAGYAELAAILRDDDAAIRRLLATYGVHWPDYPQGFDGVRTAGVAAARAYPMQGILKYHGMSDWDWRIAYMPSISVCNDAGHTLTLVEFDPELPADTATIGGRAATGRDLERVVQSLDAVRRIAGVATRARVVSQNAVRASKMGKGLGSSASASAALALAAIAALFGDAGAANGRFVSCMARLLAGSGCRSAAGGVSLWFSYPGIAHEESFAVRLDDNRQLDDVRLITVPIDSAVGLKTELAHHDAPQSSFFRPWVESRGAEIRECVAAARNGDWLTLGRWSELDSIRLHGVTMSGGQDQKIYGWEPVNITLFRMCNDLRAEGAPVYCSTDTGPTAVFLTHRDYEDRVVERIAQLGLEVIRGRIAGPAEQVDVQAARAELGI